MKERPGHEAASVVEDQRQELNFTTAAERLAMKIIWSKADTLCVTGLAVRTFEKELSAGRFPKPSKRIGRRPYWLPSVVRQWAEGEQP